jgi:IS605 OrfB family transposase
MKLTAQIKLIPSDEQAQSLLRTLERANEACQYISDYAHESGTHSKYKLQEAVYHQVRERFDLAAQMTIRALGKVADAYKTNPDAHNQFDTRGGFPYDSRILSFYTDRQEVSIWTLDPTGDGGCRERIKYEVGENHRALLEQDKGEADLIYRNGMFFLLVSCQMPSANLSDEDMEAIDGYLGVDRGVNNIATTSEGDNWTSDEIDERRLWYQKRRDILQSVGTRSAKRALRRLSGKQERFQRDTNHTISKRIVSKAKARNSAIVLEDLSGIRERTTVRRQQRARHSNWSFFQLRQFIEYKALISGVPVIKVDPAYTSQTCSKCGHCDRKNRNGSDFECRSCGHAMDADKNAARNIAAKGAVNSPNGS